MYSQFYNLSTLAPYLCLKTAMHSVGNKQMTRFHKYGHLQKSDYNVAAKHLDIHKHINTTKDISIFSSLSLLITLITYLVTSIDREIVRLTLPIFFPKSMMVATVSADVSLPYTFSRSNIIWAGEKKWVPITFCGLLVTDAIFDFKIFVRFSAIPLINYQAVKSVHKCTLQLQAIWACKVSRNSFK